MRQGIHTAALFALATGLLIGNPGYSQEQEDDDTVVRGEGWIIDLEAGSITYGDSGPAPEQASGQEQKRIHGDSGIEFIIGGQGKDGVAKRGRLPVSE
mgnify:CR=1 FL=1